MASFFKASCSVFWLVWMITLSFLFGVMQTADKYTFLTERDPLGVMMMSACTTIIVMAFLGCCCIKCDITHICCAIWYIIPTMVGTLGLCIFMLVLLKAPDGGANLQEGDVLKMVIDEWNSKHQIPGFLQYTQTHYTCCGIYGFKDYRAFILKSTTHQDVPFSCCVDLIAGQNDTCPPFEADKDGKTTMENIYIQRTIPGHTLPIRLPKKGNNLDDTALDKYATELYGERKSKDDFNWQNSLDEKLWLPVHVNKSKSILLNGCFDELKKNSERVLQSYFAFSLVLIGAATLMTILYIQNCLKARRLHHESMQDLILENAVNTTKVNPHTTVLVPELLEEDPKKILENLANPKKKLTIVEGQHPEEGKAKSSAASPIHNAKPAMVAKPK